MKNKECRRADFANPEGASYVEQKDLQKTGAPALAFAKTAYHIFTARSYLQKSDPYKGLFCKFTSGIAVRPGRFAKNSGHSELILQIQASCRMLNGWICKKA